MPKLDVTFTTGLPMGTKAVFRHEGELWIAYPAKKNQQIFSLVDRLVGIHAGIGKEMVHWINARPGDTELVARVLERVSRASALHDELCHDKTKAFTS